MDGTEIQVHLDYEEKVNRFIMSTNSFKSDIDIMTDMGSCDAKSILGVYALDLSRFTYVKIISDDKEECKRFAKAMEEFR